MATSDFSRIRIFPSYPFSLPQRIRPPESHVPEDEAMGYYRGLPSQPRLLARTGSIAWEIPKGPWETPNSKELSVVVNHKLNSTWEFEVAPKVQACLDEMQVRWTSLDIVRISEVPNCEVPNPEMTAVVLWIGVTPDSLDGERARVSVFKCLDVLKEFDIDDVDVEMRESLVFRSSGVGKLLPPIPSSFLFRDPTPDIQHDFTHALGIPLCPMDAQDSSGTGGFYMSQGSDSDPLLLVTARHVVLPPKKRPNDMFERSSTRRPRSDVLLLGDDTTYTRKFKSMRYLIRNCESDIDKEKQRIVDSEGEDGSGGDQGLIDRLLKKRAGLKTLLDETEGNWSTTESHVLGQVVYSPPITLGAGTPDEQFTEDYAVIEIDDGKIDRTKFNGNTIYVEEFSTFDFLKKMNPWPNVSPVPDSFDFMGDRVMKLSGIIPTSEMRIADGTHSPLLRVMKSGSTTCTTIGRANCIMSFVREYSDSGDGYSTSKEWAILPYEYNDRVFSDWGDSGAVVVDGVGRIGGLLTGGAGISHGIHEFIGINFGRMLPWFDISYVTPIEFLLKSIKARYPDAHLI
ncbi:hypothetical protein BDY19DRAFT_963551 [Irpex rosettiformis]|uniref:Uncharacterized protein n=1 Tax=Irpex rosettiformis TaxID=378272 RepID=A0ACB8TVD3_9APHY|nr:hypothetical protein BDY19DRAFT_963551 [Irpex rosettiformis]